MIYAIVFLAGLYNAAMDKLKDHFSSSIWWDKIPFGEHNRMQMVRSF